MNPSASGVRPPQQARSRAALRRLLESAEHVLVNEGMEQFTIARVAEHAGVSVGGVYRRFANKDQLVEAVRQDLLARLEGAVADSFEVAEPSLAGVLDAFASALGRILARSGHLIPAVLAGGGAGPESGRQAADTIVTLQRRFADAAAPYRDQIRHPEPDVAMAIAFRSVIGAAAHRAAISPWWPDGLTWPQWARETARMTTAYLMTEPQPLG